VVLRGEKGVALYLKVQLRERHIDVDVNVEPHAQPILRALHPAVRCEPGTDSGTGCAWGEWGNHGNHGKWNKWIQCKACTMGDGET